MSNIWIAAGDGDLARVEELVLAGTLPNIPDEFTYTPMHAAASYGHIHVLEFLLAHGGDVNITDDDGETPLYVVEDVVTARWLIDHGAVIDRTNNEGVSVAYRVTRRRVFPSSRVSTGRDCYTKSGLKTWNEVMPGSLIVDRESIARMTLTRFPQLARTRILPKLKLVFAAFSSSFARSYTFNKT
ncbi:ankyrin [Guyanagaster necrorhizus]|uniref:Ankyrin n=1 Tax=Guyanagaster necrorhizus TaxID=856835 RepID=A0A9P7W302_9AGAR|nr:ankyrin [Guyanagaster necrorhizus MCA 3950]KAG7451124.1 ankyrin [Guyanagaster necrorhizus MCA 3950]